MWRKFKLDNTISTTFIGIIVTVYDLNLTEEIYKGLDEDDYLQAPISNGTAPWDVAAESFVLWVISSSTLTSHPYH